MKLLARVSREPGKPFYCECVVSISHAGNKAVPPQKVESTHLTHINLQKISALVHRS